jgi:hypothetical protein
MSEQESNNQERSLEDRIVDSYWENYGMNTWFVEEYFDELDHVEIHDRNVYGDMPEGWENWLKDPDTDADAWDMPDSWWDR